MQTDQMTTKRGRGRPRVIEAPKEQTVTVPGALEIRLRVLGMLEGNTPDSPVSFSAQARQALELWWQSHPMREQVECIIAKGKAPPPMKPARQRKK